MQALSSMLDGEAGIKAPTPTPYSNTNDFSAEALAGGILSAIGEQFAGMAELPDEVLSQIRAGVEQGFNEARDIFSQMGMLTEDMTEQLDSAFALVMEGLDNINQPAQAAAPTVSQVSQSANLNYASNQSSFIQIKTQEGDVVTIERHQEMNAAISAYRYVDSLASGFEVKQSLEASRSLSFSVQGDLNKDEMKAINHLVKRADGLTNRLFQGNVQAAFAQAQHMGFDGEVLASFSLEASSQRSVVMSESTQVSFAPATTSLPSPEVPEPLAPAPTSQPAAEVPELIAPAVALGSDIAEVMAEPEESSQSKLPSMMTLGDLLGQMLDMKLGMSDNNELLRAGVSMLKDMIEHMQESLSEREHESEENDE
jgi:hypothetical protein